MSKRPTQRRNTNVQASNTARNIAIGAVFVLGVLGLGILLYLNLRPPAEIEGVVEQTGLSRGHDNNVQVGGGELPPMGGVHFDRWQNCGIYTEPIEAGHAVHSLEHGAVWITYQPDLAAEEIKALQDMVRSERFLLLSPYPGQRSPIVLTAWARQLEVESADDSRISEFIARYRLGPTTPERGATCSNGVGDPIS